MKPELFKCEKHPGLRLMPMGCYKTRMNRVKRIVAGYKRENQKLQWVPAHPECQDCETGRRIEEELAMPVETKVDQVSESQTLKELNKLSDAFLKKARETKPAGRICSDAKCELAGKEQPLSRFRGGYTICKKCHGRRAIEGREAKRSKQEQQKPKAEQKPVKEITLEQLRDDHLLKALFLGYESLLEALAEEATEEIRDPRMQLLWIVRDRYARKEAA